VAGLPAGAGRASDSDVHELRVDPVTPAPRPARMMMPYGAAQPPATLLGRARAFVSRVLGQFRAYLPNFSDRSNRITQDQVSVERIESALNHAWIGFMPAWAEINDLMGVNPIVRGLKKHLKSGVKRYLSRLQVMPPPNVDPSRAALAQEIADDVRNAIENNADAPFTTLLDSHIECELRGGGLIEPSWKCVPAGKPNAGKWYWTGFELVTQHRVRFDRFTGEICFAETAFQFTGQPVSSFLPGTFIAVTPERAVPDFSKRGTMRSVLTDWFAMQNCAGWWQDDIERLGSPIVAATYDSDADRETMNKAIKEMGANGGLSYRKGGDVKLVEKSSRTGPKGSAHNEFETTRVQRMSIAFLGAAQTIQIDANTGSQESSGNMAEVADDVCADYWEHFFGDVRRDLVQVVVGLNYGLENVDLTPILGVDLEEAAEASTTLDAYTKGGAIGVPVGEDFARKKLKWPKPGPGEKPLGVPAADPAAADAGTVGSGPRALPAADKGAA
jgi:hypothetical protein